MDKLISSPQLRKHIANISLESFESSLNIIVDREYQSCIPFTQSLICIYMNSINVMISNLDTIVSKKKLAF